MALEVLSSDNTAIFVSHTSPFLLAVPTFPNNLESSYFCFLDLQFVKNIHDRMVRKMYRL